MNRLWRDAAFVVFLVCTIPFVALVLPPGFIPLYFLIALLLCGDWHIVNDEDVELEEDRQVRVGLAELERLANGEENRK